jgi:predicted metalloprotease with PDZ domain
MTELSLIKKIFLPPVRIARFHKVLFAAVFFFSALPAVAQKIQSSMAYHVSMPEPASHIFHIVFTCSGIKAEKLDLKMPAWTPGYYQLLHYAKNIENFKVSDEAGKEINWSKPNQDGWQLQTNNTNRFIISYDVKATTQFVAQSFLDSSHGYIVPAGIFLYVANKLNHPVTVTVEPYKNWHNVATGLEPVAGKQFTYIADDFDILYDSPILIGNLETLAPFTVKGITHWFTGYKPGEFNREEFIKDLKKIVEAGVDIIGDIPYKHYTFLAIGPGRGGIEHLNSTTIGFDGSQLNTPEGKRRMLTFIAHEYFHHYNVKRIRPVELGPFDYENGSRTKMLWVSEGLSVYYEYMMVKRKGLMTQEELLNSFRSNMMAYENKPGHLYQSVAEASYETWSDGPFGRTGDEVNKTISYYDKGPVLGLMLDFKIRHETKNNKSLDDVMRLLYTEFYKQKKRGFTEAEFKTACETIAGTSLHEFFEYIYTVKAPDYPKYFLYAGLAIDTLLKALPGGWLGISSRYRNDTLSVTAVDWNSPAWNAGIRSQDKILLADGAKMQKKQFDELVAGKTNGDKIKLLVLHNNSTKEIEIILTIKLEKSFTITPVSDPDKLQMAILKDWLKE